MRHVRNECGQSPPFRCPHCSPWNQQATSRVTLVQSNRLRRKQDHLKVKLHGCPRCLRKYKRNADLKRHMLNECGQSPRFKCPYCPNRSKQFSQIYVHIRAKHPGQIRGYVDLKTNVIYTP
ncbi:zinc finger X-chromosomal protein-like [Cotesia typhae]|uniref:zinc finger X-chromosomal protein-like n=1 Tax=Cotesia typhae TaxID=2053667 RepID=UPI003D68CB64